MLSERIVDAIKKIAQDRFVKIACINAMFNGCERGGDLWESLEGDAVMFSNETHIALWGRTYLESLDEEEEGFYPDSLYSYGQSHKVIGCLLDEVERQLQKTILHEYDL